jgi:hypothetical protein
VKEMEKEQIKTNNITFKDIIMEYLRKQLEIKTN